MGFDMQGAINVSTHSRPKAAGYQKALYMIINECFNTQPPEGGWHPHLRPVNNRTCFNTQPPEGGWQLILCSLGVISLFQHTAARRRLGKRFCTS